MVVKLNRKWHDWLSAPQLQPSQRYSNTHPSATAVFRSSCVFRDRVAFVQTNGHGIPDSHVCGTQRLSALRDHNNRITIEHIETSELNAWCGCKTRKKVLIIMFFRWITYGLSDRQELRFLTVQNIGYIFGLLKTIYLPFVIVVFSFLISVNSVLIYTSMNTPEKMQFCKNRSGAYKRHFSIREKLSALTVWTQFRVQSYHGPSLGVNAMLYAKMLRVALEKSSV